MELVDQSGSAGMWELAGRRGGNEMDSSQGPCPMVRGL